MRSGTSVIIGINNIAYIGATDNQKSFKSRSLVLSLDHEVLSGETDRKFALDN